jgi:hypothetical protein
MSGVWTQMEMPTLHTEPLSIGAGFLKTPIEFEDAQMNRRALAPAPKAAIDDDHHSLPL